MALSDAQSLRFSRLLLLPEVEEGSIERLLQSRVLIIGAGGLGCPVAQLLVANGIGQLHWVDGDRVDASNLPRQTLFGPADVGRFKVEAGIEALRRLAPDCTFTAETVMADAARLPAWVAGADLVLDCTDRFASRHAINSACVSAGIPLVVASAVQQSGQLLRVMPEAGCYACVFPPLAAHGFDDLPAESGGDDRGSLVDAACGAFGVLSSAVGTMAMLQGHLALETLLGLPAGRTGGQFWQVEFNPLSITSMRFKPRSGCPVCGGHTPKH